MCKGAGPFCDARAKSCGLAAPDEEPFDSNHRIDAVTKTTDGTLMRLDSENEKVLASQRP